MSYSSIAGLLLGTAVGDALGVPVEFRSRASLKANPVVGMRAFGTHHQEAGTWSDDSALSFCLAEQLIEGFDIEPLAQKISRWYFEGYWSARGEVFDVGIATRNAIDRLEKGIHPCESGECEEYSNGNGSLMRILPLVFYLHDKSIEERWETVSNVSGITHGHIRSKLACFFLVEYGLLLYKAADKYEAFGITQNLVRDFAHGFLAKEEYEIFTRIFFDDLRAFNETDIYASGYVIHSLEASIWAFLSTDTFAEAVLKAVNLGDDADTTGAITGALAGLYYGQEAIPKEWIEILAKQGDIKHLATKLLTKCS